MEAKTSFFLGKGDFDKVCPEFNSYLFSFIFQDPKEGSRQAGEVAKVFPLGWRSRAEENRLDKLGISMSIKGEGRFGN